jgi:hypothetical protein
MGRPNTPNRVHGRDAVSTGTGIRTAVARTTEGGFGHLRHLDTTVRAFARRGSRLSGGAPARTGRRTQRLLVSGALPEVQDG